jgi:hypothetical protein
MFNSVLKRGLFLLCISIFSTQCLGQWAIPWQIRGEKTLDHLVNANEFVRADVLLGTLTVNVSPSVDSYIDQKWNNCSFLLFDSEKLMEGYLARYDLRANTLAVKSKNGIRLIEVKKIKSIIWLDSLTHAPRYFVNAKDYKEENIQLTGLLEVLVDGQMPLLAQSYLAEKEVGFFVSFLSLFEKGEREKKYEQKKMFYTGNGNALSKITSEKELLLSFGDFYWEMEEYIEKNKLDISMQAGLQKVFEHYNTKFERLPDY